MSNANPRRLVAVFAVIVLVAVVGAVAVSAGGGTGAADGEEIDGQSPEQFQPEAVNQEIDPETGDIEIDATQDKRILVDTRHSNQISQSDLEPVLEAAFASGHTVDIGADSTSTSTSFGGSNGNAGYGQTLSNYDAVMIIQPTGEFTASERNAVQNYTDAGGRVAILGEPTQVSAGLGLFSVPSAVSFGATNLTRSYGFQVGAETLYNMNEDGTDNNFKSVYGSSSSDSDLTDGAETVNFDRSGYVVVNDENADQVEVLYTAVDDTKTLDTRREGTYPIAVRNDNVVFVADSSFIQESEVYDVDNEAFVGNLLGFLASGDLDSSFPSSGPSTSPPTPPEPPGEPTPPAELTPSNETSG